MHVRVFPDKASMGAAAAADGAARIRDAAAERGEARIILATGASQFEMLDALTREPDVPWHRVTVFHLDEYIGLPIDHPASFRLYLWQRFHRKLPVPLRAFHYLDGEAEAERECRRVGDMLAAGPIDVAFIGIGENGHIAFNDPPADFETEQPYIIVQLDDACRNQQLGEGWFESFDAVPSQAISMSVRAILGSRQIVCTVPDERKAVAVRNAIEGDVTPDVPASILQQHGKCSLYLDQRAAGKLDSSSRQ